MVGPAAASNLSAFGELYLQELRDGLQGPDRNSISFLRGLAEENKKEEPSVTLAIEQHLLSVSELSACLPACLCVCYSPPDHVRLHLTSSRAPPPHLQCKDAHKLPALYLVDCIIKVVGEPYLSAFIPKLPKVSNVGLDWNDLG